MTVRRGGRTVVFGGDLGRTTDPLLRPAQPLTPADYLVTESTYGDRTHARGDPIHALGEVVRRTVARGGVVIIPSFAVGRAQAVLYHLAVLRSRDMIPPIPIFIDSPMAADATRLLLAHPGEHRLSEAQCVATMGAATITNSVEESKAIDRRSPPMVIISASGMATRGRVLFHIERFGGNRRNTILFAGYQAAGTRGAAMLGGAASVKVHGRHVPIRAEVLALNGHSAHADREEIMAWLRPLDRPLRTSHTGSRPRRTRSAAGSRRSSAGRSTCPRTPSACGSPRRRSPCRRNPERRVDGAAHARADWRVVSLPGCGCG